MKKSNCYLCGTTENVNAICDEHHADLTVPVVHGAGSDVASPDMNWEPPVHTTVQCEAAFGDPSRLTLLNGRVLAAEVIG